MKFYGTRTYVFPFWGDRLAISKGPFRYLLNLVRNEKYPLFNMTENLEIDPEGSLFNREEPVQEKVRR